MSATLPAGQVPTGVGDLTYTQSGSSVSPQLILFLVGGLALVTALTAGVVKARARARARRRRNPRRRVR